MSIVATELVTYISFIILLTFEILRKKLRNQKQPESKKPAKMAEQYYPF